MRLRQLIDRRPPGPVHILLLVHGDSCRVRRIVKSATSPPRSRALSAWPWLLLLSLAAAGVRWLTRSPVVYNWDSVHYVLAQDRYDILAHQPHPPGSWYYVWLARAARLLTGDAHGALLLESALLGGGLVATLFLLGRDLRGERAGWLAAALGAFAPLFWFYGSIGLNYGPSGTLSALVALGCVRMCLGISPLSSALLAGGVLGVLGGFRPTDVVFLAPAYLWSLGCAFCGCRVRGNTYAASLVGKSVGLSLVLTLGWLIPNCVNTGGLHGYLESLRGQEHLLARSSVFLASWPALWDAWFTHRRALESTLGAAWLPLAAIPLVLLARRWAGGGRRASNRTPPHLPLMVLGVLLVFPAFAFYLLGHFNSPGYTLVYAGFLAAVAAAWMSRAFVSEGEPASGSRLPPGWIALVALVSGANVALFLHGWPWLGKMGQRSLSYAEIADHARYYRELAKFVRGRHRPGSVQLLASWNSTDGLRVVESLLPEYSADVAQAVAVVPQLPANFHHLSWLRLMTPAQIEAKRLPVYAVARTAEDPGFHHSPELFGDRWDLVPIGPHHFLYRLRPAFSVLPRSTDKRE